MFHILPLNMQMKTCVQLKLPLRRDITQNYKIKGWRKVYSGRLVQVTLLASNKRAKFYTGFHNSLDSNNIVVPKESLHTNRMEEEYSQMRWHGEPKKKNVKIKIPLSLLCPEVVQAARKQLLGRCKIKYSITTLTYNPTEMDFPRTLSSKHKAQGCRKLICPTKQFQSAFNSMNLTTFYI